MLLRKPDRAAVPELWVITDSTRGEQRYLGQLVYHITHCAQFWSPGLGTIGNWRVKAAEKGGQEGRQTQEKREKGNIF